jgi:hypothetical protein
MELLIIVFALGLLAGASQKWGVDTTSPDRGSPNYQPRSFV